jgi:RHS repeat-associated protein
LFEKDSDDGNYTAWGKTGTWSAANGYMRNDRYSGGSSYFYRSRSQGDAEIRFSYLSEDTSSGSYYMRADLRHVTTGRVSVWFSPSTVRIMEWDGTTWYTRAEANLSTQQGQWYDVAAKLNGSSVVIKRRAKGGEFAEVLTGTVNLTTTTLLQFLAPANAVFRVDDIMVIDGTMQSAYTMTYNNANELTQMANSTQGTTVALTYDDWGRTVSQTVGSKSATYAYKYGSKLASVTSTLFGEANVAFEYGGDQKRRSMTTGGVTTGYNWDMDWNVINEEDGAGALARTYTHNPQSGGRATLGHVDGTNPATGAYRYYLHDHLGSTRFVFDDEVNLLATYQYTPYGDILSSNNPNTTTHLFTGHDWNPASNLYFAPFRFYSPQSARWNMRDPLGMIDGPNIYVYVRGNPILYADPFGATWREWRDLGIGVIGFLAGSGVIVAVVLGAGPITVVGGAFIAGGVLVDAASLWITVDSAIAIGTDMWTRCPDRGY